MSTRIGHSEATALHRRCRILIMGNSGSGKSTLARTLDEHLDLPVVHIDTLYWQPGWVLNPDRDQAIQAAAEQPAWIFDGSKQLDQADTVIFLDINRFTCLFGVLKRWAKYYGKTRPDMTEGCHEKIDLSFLCYIWSWPKRKRRRILAWMSELPPPKQGIHLRGRRAVKRFLAELAQ
ncbi:MAG: hypothetical protein FWD06_03355 [Oscillospiraceae bacterium]|nr:hypothetical protein [Oscillospiraceae bacterium]